LAKALPAIVLKTIKPIVNDKQKKSAAAINVVFVRFTTSTSLIRLLAVQTFRSSTLPGNAPKVAPCYNMSLNPDRVGKVQMIVNRSTSKRIFLSGTIVLASSTLPLAALAQDKARGWETPDDSNPPQKESRRDNRANDDIRGNESRLRANDGDSRQNDGGGNDRRSPEDNSGWNKRDDGPRSSNPAGGQETSASGSDVFQAGDASFNAGRYSEALQKLDEAWRGVINTRPSGRTTAQFFERKAMALRGMQQLMEAERLLKQAIGNVTAGSGKDQDLYSRILFELADLQCQEGLPRDGAVTAGQARTAMSSAGVSKIETVLAVETTNTLGRLLTDCGDVKNADSQLDDAYSKAGDLPPSSNINLPPQSSASRYGDVVTAKVKVNRFYLKDTKGGVGKLKRDLDDAISILRNYSTGAPPDTRYSILTLQLEKDEPTLDAVNAALTQASQLPGSDNLVEAAILMKKANLMIGANDLKGAAEALKRALAIRTKVLPAYSIYIAETLVKMSEVQLKLGRPAEAAASAQRASSALERSAGRKSLHFARASLATASIYMASNKFSQVEPLLIEAVNTFSAVRGRGDSETLHAIDMLCSTYIRNKKYAQAASYAELALAGGEKLYASNSPNLVLSLTNLGTIEAHTNKFAESNAHLQRAQNILLRTGKSGTAEYAEVLASIGVSYTLQKKYGPAQNSIKQARSIYTTIYGANSAHATQMTELLKTVEAMKAGPRIPGHNILLENSFKPSSPQYR
jgi:tetratricopeptide (TPR) repeat protein